MCDWVYALKITETTEKGKKKLFRKYLKPRNYIKTESANAQKQARTHTRF